MPLAVSRLAGAGDRVPISAPPVAAGREGACCAVASVFLPDIACVMDKCRIFAKRKNEAMIRSIPNPPMDRDDVARFRHNLEKHLRGDFCAEERHRLEARQARTKANAGRIIANCGGKNPLLEY